MNERIPDPGSLDPIGKRTLEVISKATRLNQWVYSAIQPFLKGAILEIGSGIGNISQYVIKDGFDIVLSDANPEYCEQLGKTFSGESHVKQILQIDLLHPGFTDHYAPLKEKFDTLILLNVIEHIENDPKAIANCRFMLKPGGHLIVLAPAYTWLYCRLDKELGHYRRYTSKKMKAIIKKEGYAVLKAHYFNLTGMLGWFFFGKILRRKVLGREMNVFNRIVPFAKMMDKIIFKKTGLSVIVAGVKRES